MKYKYEFLYDSRQDYLWDEYQDYIAQKPMTAYERRLVRNWVKAGNSVYGCTQSRYYGESAYPMEFLEVYRADREIDRDLQGKTPKEKEAYLKELLGYEEEPAEEKELRKAKAGHLLTGSICRLKKLGLLQKALDIVMSSCQLIILSTRPTVKQF